MYDKDTYCSIHMYIYSYMSVYINVYICDILHTPKQILCIKCMSDDLKNF